MNHEIQDLRDALIERLHGLADDQDQRARSAMQECNLRRESAHRGAAVGLRMAAGVVSENLSLDPAARSLGSLPGEPGDLGATTRGSWPTLAARGI